MMSDPITESAKATQEVAKGSAKALEAAEGLGGWLDRVFGEPIEHSVKSIWTNKIRERSIAGAIHSWERLELLLRKTEERLRKQGVKEFRFVPPKLALPLLQNATMEDVDDLHSLWSNCQFTTYEQCMGTASGNNAYCGISPRFAFAPPRRGYRWGY
jgi:hypothetical protein